MDPIPPARIADLLSATPATVTAELDALGDLAGWPPADGEWSANACVGHLLEAERRGFAGRIRHILAEDRPVLAAWDPPAVAAARHDDERPGSDAGRRVRGVAVRERRPRPVADERRPREGGHPSRGR